MKNITYSFSNSDIETILFTLSMLPSLDIEKSETQFAVNLQCCFSASQKLIKHDKIAPNEFRVIYASLKIAQLVNQGKFPVEDELKRKCNRYLFSINNLVSIFDNQVLS